MCPRRTRATYHDLLRAPPRLFEIALSTLTLFPLDLTILLYDIQLPHRFGSVSARFCLHLHGDYSTLGVAVLSETDPEYLMTSARYLVSTDPSGRIFPTYIQSFLHFLNVLYQPSMHFGTRK